MNPLSSESFNHLHRIFANIHRNSTLSKFYPYSNIRCKQFEVADLFLLMYYHSALHSNFLERSNYCAPSICMYSEISASWFIVYYCTYRKDERTLSKTWFWASKNYDIMWCHDESLSLTIRVGPLSAEVKHMSEFLLSRLHMLVHNLYFLLHCTVSTSLYHSNMSM